MKKPFKFVMDMAPMHMKINGTFMSWKPTNSSSITFKVLSRAANKRFKGLLFAALLNV